MHIYKEIKMYLFPAFLHLLKLPGKFQLLLFSHTFFAFGNLGISPHHRQCFYIVPVLQGH